MHSLGLLIFDMDGTLVDSMGHHAQVFGQLLHESYGLPQALGEKMYLETAGQPLDRQYARSLEMLGADPRIAKELTARFWERTSASGSTLFPDVKPAIDELARVGYTLALTSGSIQEVVDVRMTDAGINRCFSVMLGTDYANPAAAKGEGHYRMIRQRLGLTPEQFGANGVMIGDAEFDMKIANDAGLLAIGRITQGNEQALTAAGARHLIHSLDDLCALLKGAAGYRAVQAIRKA